MLDREYQSFPSWDQPGQGPEFRALNGIVVGLGVVVPIGLVLFAVGALMIVGQSN